MKILRNLCLHFARQDGQDGKKRKENHATKVTKISKTKRRKYGMNKTLNLSEPAFFLVSHEPGGAHISPPFYLSPEASEELVLNMTIVGYLLKIFLRYITLL